MNAWPWIFPGSPRALAGARIQEYQTEQKVKTNSICVSKIFIKRYSVYLNNSLILNVWF